MEKVDLITQRRIAVKRLFTLTGDEFVQEVLKFHRGGDTGPSAEMREQYEIEDNELLGRKWYRIRAKDVPQRGKTAKILYLHGGGFVLEAGAVHMSFAGYMATKTGAEIWFPEWPLAPEHTCVDAVEMVLELYKMMLKETAADTIAVMGESAGGGLTAASAVHFREKRLPQPNHLIMISPCTEFELPATPEEEAYFALLVSRDERVSPASTPTLGELWRGDLPLTDYRASPSFADLSGLAPMLVFSGTAEFLNFNIRHFVDAARKQGAQLRYYEKEMMQHAWVIFPGEAEEEKALIVETLLHPDK